MKSRNTNPKQPVVILAPNGSRGSLFAAALGRHPNLFAAPHLNLLAFENLRQFARFAKMPRDVHTHGLVRMLAWMLVGDQSIEATQAARRWLARHSGTETRAVHQMIARWLHPRRLVEYSPLYAYHRRVVQRVVAAAPDATFIHLVRHPTATTIELASAAAQTIDAALGRYTAQDPNQPCLDIVELTDVTIDWQAEPPVFDPQFLWYRVHTSIAETLADLPRNRAMRVRTEDFLADPEQTLASVCRRLRLPVIADVLRGMLRTEEDPFASLGPFGASRGVDWDLVVDPRIPQPDLPARLDGPLPWRGDGLGYRPEVVELANKLGYRSTGALGPAPTRLKMTRPSATPSNHAAAAQ